MRKIDPVIIDGVECKRCPKCGSVKPYSEFYHRHSHCKACEVEWAKNNVEKRREISKRWARNNPEKIRISVLKWNKKNIDKVRKATKNWAKNNPEKIKEATRKWREKNPEKVLETQKKWRKANPDWRKRHPDSGKEARKKWEREHPEKRREYSKRSREKHWEYRKLWRENNRDLLRGYDRKRRSTAFGRLNSRMGVNIWQSLRQNKNGRHWETLVEYTLEDLKKHLESKFTDGMSWENMGKWHTDHVIPKSRFHYEKPEDPEFKICWALVNLQPMWKLDNLSKHAKTMEEWKKYKEANEKSETVRESN